VNVFAICLFGYLVVKNLRKIGIEPAEDVRRENKVDIFSNFAVDSSNIVFVGDSHIERCHWYEAFEDCNVLNRGIGGDNSKGLLDRIHYISESKPKKIFIMIGINDVIKGVPVDVTVSNVTKIVKEIKKDSENSQIYLHSVIPANNSVWKHGAVDNEKVVGINQAYSQIPDCEYIDLCQILVENNEVKAEYTADGVHLSGLGYRLWKSAIEKYVFD